jgi:peptidyl-prolyl cis-trans isomerase B (cyclophilin B)
VLSEGNPRHLNGDHTVFGKVTDGVDIVKTIKQNDSMSQVRVSDTPPAKE